MSLVQGSRYVWAGSTTDSRALENTDATARTAAYYDPSQVQVQLTFSSAYSGNLDLYAVDWDYAGRTETITAGGQTANLSNFGQGTWVTIPITQPANSTLTITVTNTGPANAVLWGSFSAAVAPRQRGPLRQARRNHRKETGQERTAPPATTSQRGTTAPMSPHYPVYRSASDRPAATSGHRERVMYERWRTPAEPPALHRATTTAVRSRCSSHFTSAYSGNLELYAVDWDSQGRSETVTVGSQSTTLSNFTQGDWVTFPVTVNAGGTVTITVTRDTGANAVLSGIFLN